jgi:hypothetical protein
LNTTLTPHSITHGDACFAYFNKIWGIPSMLLKKDYEGGLLATLIQDQEQMRNHDSRNHLPGFVRFNF